MEINIFSNLLYNKKTKMVWIVYCKYILSNILSPYQLGGYTQYKPIGLYIYIYIYIYIYVYIYVYNIYIYI